VCECFGFCQTLFGGVVHFCVVELAFSANSPCVGCLFGCVFFLFFSLFFCLLRFLFLCFCVFVLFFVTHLRTQPTNEQPANTNKKTKTKHTPKHETTQTPNHDQTHTQQRGRRKIAVCEIQTCPTKQRVMCVLCGHPFRCLTIKYFVFQFLFPVVVFLYTLFGVLVHLCVFQTFLGFLVHLCVFEVSVSVARCFCFCFCGLVVPTLKLVGSRLKRHLAEKLPLNWLVFLVFQFSPQLLHVSNHRVNLVFVFVFPQVVSSLLEISFQTYSVEQGGLESQRNMQNVMDNHNVCVEIVFCNQKQNEIKNQKIIASRRQNNVYFCVAKLFFSFFVSCFSLFFRFLSHT